MDKLNCGLGYACDACPYRKECDIGNIGAIQKREAQKKLQEAIKNFCRIFNAEITIKMTLKEPGNGNKKSKS